MKKLLLILILILLLTSCLGTKKYNGFVCRKIKSNSYQQSKKLNDFVQIRTDSLVMPDTLSTCKKLKSLFIPAILYWQWENTIKCDLNPSTPTSILHSFIESYADSVKLKEKLNGQTLELSILKIPSSFIWTYKGHCIIFLVAYTIGELEAIYPLGQYLKVNYRLLKGGQETKTGTLTIKNIDLPIKNTWKSTRKFTWLYIDQYDKNIKNLSKLLIDKLLTEI